MKSENGKYLIIATLTLLVFLGLYYLDLNNSRIDISTASTSVISIVSKDNMNNEFYGTGFFISENKVVTNKHVVHNIDKDETYTITGVCGGDNEEVSLDVVYLSTDIDFAVLEGDFQCEHTIAKLDANQEVYINQDILLVGYTHRVGKVIYEGNIAGYIKEIEYSNENILAFPVSVDVHPGMSGSPIYDFDGVVVGIATFRISLDSNNDLDYISFAIPMSLVIDDIENNSLLIE
jgi:serine protease DegS